MELYFTEILWPDFRRENLFEAITNYQKRRRFGKTSEQIEKEMLKNSILISIVYLFISHFTMAQVSF